MTPAAPAQATPPTRGGWLSSVVVLGYIAAVLWIAAGRPPIRLSVLHTGMRALQRLAGWLGAAGLHTEAAYRREVDTHRGGA